jgi:hypothetical protein
VCVYLREGYMLMAVCMCGVAAVAVAGDGGGEEVMVAVGEIGGDVQI